MSDRIRDWPGYVGIVAITLVSSACAVGPKYVRPDAPVSPAFKEAAPSGWKDAQPNDGAHRGDWWSIFGDPQLDTFERKVQISNQNVLAAEAQYRAAVAAVRVSRAGLFPAVTASPSATANGGRAATGPKREYVVPVDVSYQVDVWGSIRRSVAENMALAQASAAQLENARLLFQAELAADYFQMQGLDASARLLDATVKSYEQYLQLTQDRYEGGVVSQGDVALARTQLETARGELIDLGVQRALFEHAIAVLVGSPPSALSLASLPAQSPPPAMQIALPSVLLERRPDIAASERQVAAANEEIGIARAAFFPALSIGAGAGSQAAAIADLLTVPTRFWSVGAQLAETLFDGGRRRGQVKVAQATYDATVANYRQTVLTGLQQVEDSLAQLRILSNEADVVSRAIDAAQQSLDISTVQYRGGLTNYLQVITAQTSLLENQRAAVDLLTRRLVASVSLVQALGGGWIE